MLAPRYQVNSDGSISREDTLVDDNNLIHPLTTLPTHVCVSCGVILVLAARSLGMFYFIHLTPSLMTSDKPSPSMVSDGIGAPQTTPFASRY